MKTIKKLCNDIVWIHDQNQNINTITISVFFRTGTYYESDRNYGISHLTEHLFFRRLDQLPQKEVYHAAESIGSFLRGRTFRDFVCFDMTVVPKYFQQAANLIFTVLHPFSWTADELAAEKRVVLRQIKNKNESFEEWQERLYFANAKHDTSIMGQAQTIQRIDIQSVNAWKRKYFTCNNACVVVTGALTKTDLQFAEQKLKKIINPGKPVLRKEILPRHLFSRTSMDDHILPFDGVLCYGWINFDVENGIDSSYAAMIANLLCRGDGSRLAYRLKDCEAISDYIEAYVTAYSKFSTLTVAFSADNCDLERVLQSIFQEIISVKHAITKDDFETTIPYFTDNLVKEADDPKTLSFEYGVQDFILQKPYDVDEALKKNQEATAEQLTAVAARIFSSENMSIFIENNAQIMLRKKIKILLETMRRQLNVD